MSAEPQPRVPEPGDPPGACGMPGSLAEAGCITCGDVGVEMRVHRVVNSLALCADGAGEVREVETALVEPVEAGDRLLVHADVALVRLGAGEGIA
jgi:hydrogenase maturation factor